jgi:hypothetical protein
MPEGIGKLGYRRAEGIGRLGYRMIKNKGWLVGWLGGIAWRDVAVWRTERNICRMAEI